MSFQEAVTTVFTQKYADFSGRARRSEYWFAYLATLLGYVVVAIIGAILHFQFLVFIAALAVVVPSLAAAVRRLHDTGKSGWLVLIGIIPIIGAIVLIVFFVTDSDPGTNAYGPSPKSGELNQAPNANWGQS